MTRSLETLRRDALAILESSLLAVHGGAAVARAMGYDAKPHPFTGLKHLGLSLPENGDIHILAVGKAALPMARMAEIDLDERVASGLLITNQPRWGRRGRIRTIMASHPLPNEDSLEAGREALDLADRLRKGDVLVALVSGGASAMMEDTPVSLDDLRACYNTLLRSGLDIRSQNEVRKGLSNIKGGRLAERVASRGAQLVSLILSDIVGDPIEDIGSGPTAPYSSRGSRARAILQGAGLWDTMPTSVRQALDRVHAEGREWRDTKGLVHASVVANNEQACRAAVGVAEARGYSSRFLGTSLNGEAREAAAVFLGKALSWDTLAPDRATIAGGETVVTVRGPGRGGRNQEFALASVDQLAGKTAVLLACGTDGVDGSTEVAGAIVDGTTRNRARSHGMDPNGFLERNDSYGFFRMLDDHVVTGPTGTNVSDLVILLEDRSEDLE